MLPRIPQLYYGTEILMHDFDKPGDHGLIRSAFPGGGEGDPVNAFTGEGLTDEQKDMQAYLKKILNYRKQSTAIHKGKTVHFAPENGVYVLFRIHEDETVVHIMNKNESPVEIDLRRFEEIGLKGKTLKNILTDVDVLWENKFTLKETGTTLLTTKFN